ncbi:C1 family peptidase [Algisphaera agarilytica]|uniref:Aminopeptidase n=1 Tax=Algisphaera agarilytica TaxID=1385975 RepID=A0A7X0LL79_9BACT|nr:C1 family peptidase [Algisphaera agarilytica]MBB6429708.1 bleomycin hydrolase [Algisphaera agarilytica]
MTTLSSSSSPTSADAGISPESLAQWRQAFDENPQHRLMQNAVTRAALDDVALDREVVTGIDHTFSHVLDDWAVTSQKKSGRCWMFAGLNLLRVGAMKKMNLKAFEFSQNYTFFWDKLERANYFFEQILLTADRDIDDRVVAYLLDHPLDDGGQWNMFVNVVKKYGLVPKSAMPESESSSNTPRMNANLKTILREGAATLRNLKANGAVREALDAKKQDLMQTVYRVLAIHLGTPPTEFDWRWNDKDKQFHHVGTVTPQEFAEKYCTIDLDDYVCLVHDPRPSSPQGKAFTVAHLGNVLGGDYDGGVRYVNVDINLMKDVTRRSMTERGEPVWMGCDVGKMMHRELGIWDAKLFDYEGVYNASFTHDKADRLIHHQTLMTHAMMFTGVDVDPGTNSARRWRVENSWGDENGIKGYYTMNDSWFDEYMFEVAVHKDLLPADVVAAAQSEPVVLPPWDPMGSLAE